jgi:hypothetical protein
MKRTLGSTKCKVLKKKSRMSRLSVWLGRLRIERR